MNENPEIASENINKFLCDNCGANMVFDPKSGKLLCPYCSAKKTISTNINEILEHDLLNFLSSDAESLLPMAKDAMQVTCSSCGATVTFVPPETATSCDFCAAKIVAQPKAADPLVAPEAVIPFSVDDRAATTQFKSWTGSRWFAPTKLKTLAEHDRAHSVYIPYWTFDADANSTYSGSRGEDYQESYTYTDDNGDERIEYRTQTNWYSTSGSIFRHFDDVPVPASTSVLPKYLDRLSWNFADLVSYDPGYLSGHRAQTYQVTLEQGFETFRSIADRVIHGDVVNDIGGDRQQVDFINTDFSSVTFKHILVPVYAGAYRFNNKVYQVIVNGRTGEVYGERPYSTVKIGCLVFAIAILLFFVILIVSVLR